MTEARRVVIAVASGKGGTGKTTVAVHLALALARSSRTVLLDLDVEAPDVLGYFPGARLVGEPESVTVAVPRLEAMRCTGCGLCAKACRFGAILAIGGVVTIDEAICKGCGRCVTICPELALYNTKIQIGTTARYEADTLELLEGRLSVGDIRSTAVIEAVKRKASEAAAVHVRDCPPGVSCPAVHALEGADFAVLVAEPTAFSLHDLDAAVRLAKGQGIPAGILVNKAGFGTADLDTFAGRHGVPIIGHIAFSRERAQAGASGRLWENDAETAGVFDRLARHILEKLGLEGAA